MFRKSRKPDQPVDGGSGLEPHKPRFQIEKLEERIAPARCHYNPHGKLVGCGRYRGRYR